jgi:hypothetical protein
MGDQQFVTQSHSIPECRNQSATLKMPIPFLPTAPAARLFNSGLVEVAQQEKEKKLWDTARRKVTAAGGGGTEVMP